MGLESATYISDLVATNPTGTDKQRQGDDHIRLIKSVLKNTFPNINAAVTRTDEDLNRPAIKLLARKRNSAGSVILGSHIIEFDETLENDTTEGSVISASNVVIKAAEGSHIRVSASWAGTTSTTDTTIGITIGVDGVRDNDYAGWGYAFHPDNGAAIAAQCFTRWIPLTADRTVDLRLLTSKGVTHVPSNSILLEVEIRQY